ncbi:hypothetical protein F4809DRAFT_587657 [Biscogniauxia mediterranea]|nr:hypothetical protein F4809DRAFT_587657 [Biscogniauxia mediterranea]
MLSNSTFGEILFFSSCFLIKATAVVASPDMRAHRGLCSRDKVILTRPLIPIPTATGSSAPVGNKANDINK